MAARPVSIRTLCWLICLCLAACNGVPAESASPAPFPSAVPPTATVTPAAASTRPGLPEAAATLFPTPQPEKSLSVLVIAWDGARADSIEQWMGSGDLPTFARLAEQGVWAEYATSTDPTLTFPALTSLASGSLPSRTGIVSNTFHDASDSFYWYRVGVEEPMDAAEPVWVTASRAGLTTASIAFPGGTPALPTQMADYTIGYGVRDAYSRQATLDLAPAQDWHPLPPSYSPALEAAYRIPEVACVRLLVVDSTDDGIANYDTVFLYPDPFTEPAGIRQVDETTLRLQKGEWGSSILRPSLYAGADFLVQEITSSTVTIYHTGVYHNTAAPRALLESLNRRFGFFPSGADAYALEHGWISETDYLYMMERSSKWLAQVTAWLISTYQPDLVFSWQENFDTAGHAFLLHEPRQGEYSSERARQYQQYYRQAARLSDRALELMLSATDLDSTAILMVSDHGMAPVHSRVFVNTLLERAGLLVLDSRNYVVVEKTRAFAVASGAALNIYINLEGREENGTVALTEYVQTQQEIIRLLTELADPRSGEPVFDRVLARSELAGLGLDHPNSGDVFAQANPGYMLDGWRGRDELFAPAETYGQHGYASQLPEMQGIFFAAGRGIAGAGRVIPPVHLIDIAPTIANLLGFEPASSVDGVLVPNLTSP